MTTAGLGALCQRRTILLASSSLFDLSHVVRLNGDWPTTEDHGGVVSQVVVEGDVAQFVCHVLHQDEDRLFVGVASGQVTLRYERANQIHYMLL